MRKDLIASAIAVLAFTIVCGLAYPLLVTGAARVAFPNQADGSLVKRGGQVVGSTLIGQDFRRATGAKDADGNPVLVADPKYFQSRPSANGYNAAGTYFNNLGPNQQDLADLLRANRNAYAKLEGIDAADVPTDAATTSASGIDPHISKANARIQSRRVARARGLSESRIAALIKDNTDRRFLVFGESGVNVLELNLALDQEQQ